MIPDQPHMLVWTLQRFRLQNIIPMNHFGLSWLTVNIIGCSKRWCEGLEGTVMKSKLIMMSSAFQTGSIERGPIPRSHFRSEAWNCRISKQPDISCCFSSWYVLQLQNLGKYQSGKVKKEMFQQLSKNLFKCIEVNTPFFMFSVLPRFNFSDEIVRLSWILNWYCN